MADGMELPTGAIAIIANTSTVLKLAIQKIWSWIKVGENQLLFQKTGNNNVRVYVDATLVLQIQALDINFRQSICDIAADTGVSIGNIQGLSKKGLLKSDVKI